MTDKVGIQLVFSYVRVMQVERVRFIRKLDAYGFKKEARCIYLHDESFKAGSKMLLKKKEEIEKFIASIAPLGIQYKISIVHFSEWISV